MSLLASAAVLCLVRRGRDAVARSPLVAALALVLVAVLPVMSYRASSAGAAVLGPALADASIARSLVLGFLTPSLCAGVAFGASLRPCAAFGPQVAAAPISRAFLSAIAVGLPVMVVAVPVAPTVSAVLLPFISSAPGGWSALLPVVASLGCAFVAGGAISAAVVHRGTHAALQAVAALCCSAVAVELATRTLGGRAGGASAAVASVSLATVALAGWLSVAGEDVPVRGAHGGRPSRLARGVLDDRPAIATAWAIALGLARRRDIRIALAGSVAAALAGVGVARVGHADAATGILLGSGGAALVLASAGLAVGGAVADGSWLWCRAPVSRRTLASALLGGGGAVAIPTAFLAVLLAWVARPSALGTVAAGLATLVAGWACAVTAGAIVPWRREGVFDQSASFAAFTVTAGLATVAVSRAATAASHANLPPAIAGAAVLTLVLLMSALALAHTLREMA